MRSRGAVAWWPSRTRSSASVLAFTLCGCEQLTYHCAVALVAARDAAFELEKAEGARKLEAYDRLFVYYNDAIRIVKDDIAELVQHAHIHTLHSLHCILRCTLAHSTFQSRQSQAKKNKPEVPVKKSAKTVENEATLTFLSQYISFLKVTRTLERNTLMTDAAEARFEGKAAAGGVGTDEASKRPPRPEDLAKLYENLIQNVADLDALREKDDAEGGKEVLARSLTYKAFRCVAHNSAITVVTDSVHHAGVSTQRSLTPALPSGTRPPPCSSARRRR